MDGMNPVIGRVACSKAGRDKGKLFIVVGVLDEDYVWIADGELRPIERQKKKRIKHMKYTDVTNTQIAEKIGNGKRPSNMDLKNAIHEYQELVEARRE